ncbi:GFA family protein [Roseicyclus marinus]|uniref:GFA family protein n=1 Tax=Roseicyclus marinus TaxID=2161673 RepID=UPI002410A776|nr:GFA family protein [Roseicyclus marinus]MDG3042239.1 GFA family protein [Roseicyclus marinus]
MTEMFEASCHCGTVRFHVTLPGGLSSARRCTCSYCTMRGAVAVSANLDGIRFHAGEDNLTLYQFGTLTAQHFFCRTCGIYTHHQRRSNPEQFGVNLACLKDFSVWDLPEIPVNDGIHHPSDGAPPRIDGILRYEKTPT